MVSWTRNKVLLQSTFQPAFKSQPIQANQSMPVNDKFCMNPWATHEFFMETMPDEEPLPKQKMPPVSGLPKKSPPPSIWDVENGDDDDNDDEGEGIFGHFLDM